MLLLGGIVLAAQSVPLIPTHFLVVWSVLCRLLTCILLRHKPFDRLRCQFAGTLAGSKNTL